MTRYLRLAWQEIATLLLPVWLVLGAVCGFWWSESWVEARDYNRATGEQVSVWDAMVLDLRVQGEPRGGEE